MNKLTIDPFRYASMGNAILGIRDSGKTYGATWIAEQLLDAGIPFIAFDPIGVWRNLRVGKPGVKGYQVVVAGEDGDLHLTEKNAAKIVRAAMQEGIPLVLDLYSVHYSKAMWRRIVTEAVNILLYENKDYGLRHLFFEEAAEFVPQRVGPQQGEVYAAIEKLARMGRNAQLGYTLINQRAEEINKAVLEICDNLFLFRQKGKNSLLSLQKWLDVAEASNAKEIKSSIPVLPTGQCWHWEEGSQKPTLVKVPEKKTVHPDSSSKNMANKTAGLAVDVSDFLSRLEVVIQMEEETEAKEKEKRVPSKHPVAVQEYELTAERERREQLERQLAEERAKNSDLQNRLNGVRSLLEPQYRQFKQLFEEAMPQDVQSSGYSPAWDIWLNKLQGQQRDMLAVMIERRRCTKIQLGLLSKVPFNKKGGIFNRHFGKLRDLGLLSEDGEYVVLNEV